MQARADALRGLRQQQGDDRARRLAVLRAGHHRGRRPAVPRSRRASRRAGAPPTTRAMRRCRPIRGRRCSTSRASSAARGIRLVLFPVPDKAEPAAARAARPRARRRRRRAGAQPRRAALRGRARARRACWCSIRRRRARARRAAALHAAGHALDAGLDGGGRRRARATSSRRAGSCAPRRRRAAAWQSVAKTVSRVGDVDRHARPARGADAVRPGRSQIIHEVQDADGRAVRAERRGDGAAARRQLHQRVQPRADGLGHERGARRRSWRARSIATST